MSERLYAQVGEPGSAALPASAALQCTLLPSSALGAEPSWHVRRAELVCAALFSVLTESQQERALQALGWQPVPPPAVARRMHADDDGPEVLAP